MSQENTEEKSFWTFTKWRHISHRKSWDAHQRSPRFCRQNDATRQWDNRLRLRRTSSFSSRPGVSLPNTHVTPCVRAAVDFLVDGQSLLTAPSRMRESSRDTGLVPRSRRGMGQASADGREQQASRGPGAQHRIALQAHRRPLRILPPPRRGKALTSFGDGFILFTCQDRNRKTAPSCGSQGGRALSSPREVHRGEPSSEEVYLGDSFRPARDFSHSRFTRDLV